LKFLPGVRAAASEIDALLLPLIQQDIRDADTILDLRELLLSGGHPGKCVRCFFRLFDSGTSKGFPVLAPLRRWLETNVEIVVTSGARLLEALPLHFAGEENLEEFCQRSMQHVRMDRGYDAKQIGMKFRYKIAA
jgi:hypothetical protein